MDFCSYLFWAHDNMYEFLLLFLLFHFTVILLAVFLSPSHSLISWSIVIVIVCHPIFWCSAKTNVRFFPPHSLYRSPSPLKYKNTICQQCHSYYVLLNSWIRYNLFSIFPIRCAFHSTLCLTSYYYCYYILLFYEVLCNCSTLTTGMGYCIL